MALLWSCSFIACGNRANKRCLICCVLIFCWLLSVCPWVCVCGVKGVARIRLNHCLPTGEVTASLRIVSDFGRGKRTCLCANIVLFNLQNVIYMIFIFKIDAWPFQMFHHLLNAIASFFRRSWLIAVRNIQNILWKWLTSCCICAEW